MRALLLSALATGVAAFVVHTIETRPGKQRAGTGRADSREVQTDTLTDEDVERLSNELESML